jgi:hypothetical protein
MRKAVASYGVRFLARTVFDEYLTRGLPGDLSNRPPAAQKHVRVNARAKARKDGNTERQLQRKWKRNDNQYH